MSRSATAHIDIVKEGRQCDARILRKLDQATDHPTRLAFPEGYYLKGLVCQK